jgi:HAMP domain-containing protein
MSLRLRLTLAYGFLLVVALASFGFTAYLIAARRIYDGVDDTLTSESALVTPNLQSLTAPLTAQAVDASRTQLAEAASLDAVVQLRQPDGNLLYSSESAGTPLPAARRLSTGPRYLSRHVQNQRMRILYQPLYNNGQFLGTVEIGQSLKETDAALDEIRNVSIFGGLGVSLGGIALVYILSGGSLRGVRRVSQLARDVERTADFSRRLPEKGAGEIKELTSTFNAMITRVERTLEGQLAFLADSSHELRRPLTVLRTNLDVLKEPALSDEPSHRRSAAALSRQEAGDDRRAGRSLRPLRRRRDATARHRRRPPSAIDRRGGGRAGQRRPRAAGADALEPAGERPGVHPRRWRNRAASGAGRWPGAADGQGQRDGHQ